MTIGIDPIVLIVGGSGPNNWVIGPGRRISTPGECSNLRGAGIDRTFLGNLRKRGPIPLKTLGCTVEEGPGIVLACTGGYGVELVLQRVLR